MLFTITQLYSYALWSFICTAVTISVFNRLKALVQIMAAVYLIKELVKDNLGYRRVVDPSWRSDGPVRPCTHIDARAAQVTVRPEQIILTRGPELPKDTSYPKVSPAVSLLKVVSSENRTAVVIIMYRYSLRQSGIHRLRGNNNFKVGLGGI